MLNATPQVIMNTANIARLDRLKILALEMTGEALSADVDNKQLMPFDTGALQQDKFVDKTMSKSGKVSLVNSKNYSKRMYFHPEFNFNQTKNANAQGMWYEPYQSGAYSNFAQDTYAKIYRQLLNGTMGGI